MPLRASKVTKYACCGLRITMMVHVRCGCTAPAWTLAGLRLCVGVHACE